MLTITDDRDVEMVQKIKYSDPFQLAPPLWLVSPLASLPPETYNTFKEFPTMAIKIVAEAEVPARLKARGTMNQTNEYREVMVALRTLTPGKAIVVSLDDPAFKTMVKTKDGKDINVAAPQFAYAIRRYFVGNSVNATAYQSGPMEVTIRRQAPAPPKQPKKK